MIVEFGREIARAMRSSPQLSCPRDAVEIASIGNAQSRTLLQNLTRIMSRVTMRVMSTTSLSLLERAARASRRAGLLRSLPLVWNDDDA